MVKKTYSYSFSFRPYQRRFRQPLITNHGVWKVREGIIIRLSDRSGNVGWGEIAPVPWFGSESLPQAIAFCQELGSEVSEEVIAGIASDLPASRFGFESALFEGEGECGRGGEGECGECGGKYVCNYSYLLPGGESALCAWKGVWERGGRTFKWKIGVGGIEEEMRIFDRLIRILPAGAKLRLDANGGLSWEEAIEWLEICDRSDVIEFIEQPLSPQYLDLMLELSDRFSTPIALDESVATLPQLEECYHRGWGGIFVIKAAIAGSPSRLRQFILQNQIDAVFSSVFETNIGRNAVLNLAAELSNPKRALGFGVSQWFNEDENDWLKSFLNNF